MDGWYRSWIKYPSTNEFCYIRSNITPSVSIGGLKIDLVGCGCKLGIGLGLGLGFVG